MSLANIVPNREARAKELFARLNDADKALRESINAFGQVINDRNNKADLSATRESIDRAIQTLTALPNLGGRHEQIRKQLFDLMTRQRDLLDQFTQSSPKDWDKVEADERELLNNYKQFINELDSKS